MQRNAMQHAAAPFALPAACKHPDIMLAVCDTGCSTPMLQLLMKGESAFFKVTLFILEPGHMQAAGQLAG